MTKQTALYRAIRRIIKKLCVMALIKCGECGHDVSDSAAFCPSCGCPPKLKETKVSVEEKNVNVENGTQNNCCCFRDDMLTTDTEYEHEEVIQKYAAFVYWFTIVVCSLFFVFSVFTYINSGDSVAAVILLLVAAILTPIVIFYARVARAYAAVYANMSINLHEINMKLQK